MRFNFKNFSSSRILIVAFLFLAAISSSACNWGLFGGTETDDKQLNKKPLKPPAPVVVDGVRTSYADLYERTSPAVVQITVARKQNASAVTGDLEEMFKNTPLRPPTGQMEDRIVQGFGSGVIVKTDGTILTNHHVIEDAETISVTMNNNRAYEAKIVGSDPPSDLAVIKIEGGDFPYLELGDSDEVRIGDIVLAIGNPLGIGQSLTSGIISAKGRRTGISDGSFEDFLQTDASINRGNSGGALINLKGELIGINSQILSPSGGSIGIGFSIPSNMAKTVMKQLIETGKVRRGLLGVTIQDLTSDVAEALDLKSTSGVLVNDVRPGSAAAKAGIKRGDVITAINGDEVSDGNSLRNKVAGTMPGTEITLTVIRNGSEQKLPATLDEFQVEGEKGRPAQKNLGENKNNSEKSGKLGLSLQKLTPEFKQQLKIPAEIKGLLVVDVDPGGAAAEEGIQKGDVIMEINRQLVENIEDVQPAIDKSGKKPILLLIARNGRTTFISIKPE